MHQSLYECVLFRRVYFEVPMVVTVSVNEGTCSEIHVCVCAFICVACVYLCASLVSCQMSKSQ